MGVDQRYRCDECGEVTEYGETYPMDWFTLRDVIGTTLQICPKHLPHLVQAARASV